MPSQMTPAQEKQFREALEERARLYDELREQVKGHTAIITKGAGWYADLVGKEFIITGVQNFDRHPHFKFEGGEEKVGSMTREKYIQWNHCKVQNADGKLIPIFELCYRIRRAERIISG